MKFFLKKIVFILQLQQAFVAETIVVTFSNIGFYFLRKGYRTAMAVGDIARLAFEQDLATGTMFFFVLAVHLKKIKATK